MQEELKNLLQQHFLAVIVALIASKVGCQKISPQLQLETNMALLKVQTVYTPNFLNRPPYLSFLCTNHQHCNPTTLIP